MRLSENPTYYTVNLTTDTGASAGNDVTAGVIRERGPTR